MNIRISEDLPVVGEADICVLGGSPTGVFAAVRAARLGASVVLVEKMGHFGGVATITCTWHTLLDTEFNRTIIAGLTAEAIGKLDKVGALARLDRNSNLAFQFRPGELKLILDNMVVEAGIQPWLHTLFSAPVVTDGKLTGVVVDGKSGRGVIRAKCFIDATGDGDLASRLGLPEYRYEAVLPPTTCAFLDRWPLPAGVDLDQEVKVHGGEFGLEEGFAWGGVLPGTDVYMLAATRICGADCSKSADLTRAEIEGRRQVGAVMKVIRKYHPESRVVLQDFPASIGIRDTRHIRCAYQLTADDVLNGRRFTDAIANGSYRVDTHHQDRPGITFMYLNGRSVEVRAGHPSVEGRWRSETATNPTFYQVPLRSLVPVQYDNLILAGRMLDADKTAFSAVRVQVNTNQMGEAAGVAAYLSLDSGLPLEKLEAGKVRDALAKGGSVII